MSLARMTGHFSEEGISVMKAFRLNVLSKQAQLALLKKQTQVSVIQRVVFFKIQEEKLSLADFPLLVTDCSFQQGGGKWTSHKIAKAGYQNLSHTREAKNSAGSFK